MSKVKYHNIGDALTDIQAVEIRKTEEIYYSTPNSVLKEMYDVMKTEYKVYIIGKDAEYLVATCNNEDAANEVESLLYGLSYL